MKTQTIRIAGVCLFAMIIVAGLNAQPRQRGSQGQGPDYGKTQKQGYSQTQRYGHGQGKEWRGQGHGRMAQHFQLDLSDEQNEELKQLRMDHYKAMKPLKNKLLELKASERTLMSEEKVDLKKVNGVIDQQTDLISQIKKMQAEQKVKMKSVFTDEQSMKLEQHRKIKSYKRARAHRSISS